MRPLLAWGACVAADFRSRLVDVAGALKVDPSDLSSCIAWESGRTFSASVRNAAGSGAVGLIQFMPATAAALGTTTSALAAMRAVDQLEYVRRYFWAWRGRLHGLGDLYMAILWPDAIGKPEDYVLFDRADPDHPRRYVQNAGLDANRDGRVTRMEAWSRVNALKSEGLAPARACPMPPPGAADADVMTAIAARAAHA